MNWAAPPKARSQAPDQDRQVDRGTRLFQALDRLEIHGLAFGTVISIGAGSGSDTIFMVSRLKCARTLMIEANRAHEADLIRVRNENQDIDFVICAAGQEDGQAHFSAESKIGGALSDAGEVVALRSIDSLVRERNLPPPYLIKFDTHGAEVPILRGASETLKATSLILMEVYNFKHHYLNAWNLTFDEMSLHLKSLGFWPIDLCNPLFRPDDNVLWQMHMFFLRSNHPVFQSSSYTGA